jgi:hypothetical protein
MNLKPDGGNVFCGQGHLVLKKGNCESGESNESERIPTASRQVFLGALEPEKGKDFEKSGFPPPRPRYFSGDSQDSSDSWLEIQNGVALILRS